MKDDPEWTEIRPGVFTKPAPHLGAGPPLSREQLEWSKQAHSLQFIQKRYSIPAFVLFVLTVFAVGITAYNADLIFGIVAYVMFCLFCVFLYLGQKDREKRVKNLPPSPLP